MALPRVGSLFREDKDYIRRLATSLEALHEVFKSNISIVTASHTVSIINEIVIADASSGPITVTLPSAKEFNGYRVTVKKVDNSNNVTVKSSGTAKIDGAATKVLSTQYDKIVSVSDGTDWHDIT